MKTNISKILLALSVAALSFSANAALPDWATKVATDAGTAGTDAAALVGPAIGIALIAGITIKLVKRFANKI